MISGYRAWECAVADRQSLLDFKAGFVDRSGVFETWHISTNSCTWSSVTCREPAPPSWSSPWWEARSLTSSPTATQATPAAPWARGWCPSSTWGSSRSSGPIPSQWEEFFDNLAVITINNPNLRDDILSGIASIQVLRTWTSSPTISWATSPATSATTRALGTMDYLLVPTCLQSQNNSNVTVIYQNQGQSTSPAATASAGSLVAVAFVFTIAFGAFSSAVQFLL